MIKNNINNNKHIKEKKRKYYLQFTILSLSLSSKKNLHEGNILYLVLKSAKKTGTKKSPAVHSTEELRP